MITEQTINEAVRRLVEAASPRKVIVSGSYARGDACDHSDLDLLVIESETLNHRQEMVRLHDVLRPLRIPVDVLVTSEATFREWQDTHNTVYYDANHEGQVRYEA